MDAKKKEVEELTASDLGVDRTLRQRVTAVEPTPDREAGMKIEDDGEAHLKVLELLQQKKVI